MYSIIPQYTLDHIDIRYTYTLNVPYRVVYMGFMGIYTYRCLVYIMHIIGTKAILLRYSICKGGALPGVGSKYVKMLIGLVFKYITIDTVDIS